MGGDQVIDPDDLAPALKKALASDKPYLLEVRCSSRSRCGAGPTASCRSRRPRPGSSDERLIADLTVVKVPDGPHNIGWTHPDEVNAAFLDFLRR